MMRMLPLIPARLLALLAAPTLAQVLPDFAYQGQLLGANDEPLPGPANIQVRIYDLAAPLPAEVALFIEDHMGLPLDNGIFSIRIGGGTPVVGSINADLFAETRRSWRPRRS